MWRVVWGRQVEKQLAKLPLQIVRKFDAWSAAVENDGLQATRMRPGLHDEPLQGARFGQRSVRLSRSYRVIYFELKDGSITIVEVIEVNKHVY